MTKKTRFTVRLDDSNLEQIEEFANITRTTRSEVIRLALMSYCSTEAQNNEINCYR